MFTGHGRRQAAVHFQPSEERLDEQNSSTMLPNDSPDDLQPEAGPSQHPIPSQTYPTPSSYTYHYPQYNPYTNSHQYGQFYYATPSTTTFHHYTHNG